MKQTEELFKNGKVTSGGGRGRIYANGTAFAKGTAYGKGTGGGEEPEVTSYVVGTNKVTGETYRKDTDEAKDDFEELFDLIETAIERIEREIDHLDTKANSTYRSWAERNEALMEQISKVGEEIALQEKARAKYLEAANAVGLSSEWKKKIQNGSLDITTVTDETLAEKIKDYENWYSKMLECEDAILELTETENDLIQQKFDNVITRYENLLSVVEHEKNMLDEYINQAEAQGHLVSENYYKALIDNERESISTLQKEKAELMAQMGNYEVGTEAWYNAVQEIDNVTLAIEEANTAILEYEQTIQQLSWEVFDLIQDKISAITEEADFLIELMSNKKLFEDNGQFTDEGMATVGLHGQNYNVYMHQADLAREEAERIKAQMASDPYDMELDERYREMIALQQEYILNAEQEKDAIKSLVEEGIELEIDALEERIDLYLEELESAKNLYEYNKRIEEQTKNIANLRKQLTSIENDDSEEAKARIQELKVSLEEAESDLEQTLYDQYVEDQQKMLDALVEQYSELLNTRIDNIDMLMMDMITEVNANASTISATISESADNVGYTLSDAMKTTWDTSTASINGVIAMYGDKFSSTQTTTYTAISAIKSGVQTMISQLNSIASQKAAEAAKSSAAKSTTTTTTSSSSTNTTKQNTSSKSSSSSKNLTDDQLMGIAASIWVYGSGSGWGNDPIRSGKLTEKFDAATAKKVQSLINKHGPNGDLHDFWVKKNYNLDKYKYSAFKSGARSINASQLAWTQEDGQEFIVRPSDGAILTPVAKGDSVLTSAASSNIWDMANSPAEFIKDNLNLGVASAPNNSNVSSATIQNFENIVFSMPNVKNYGELLSELQKDSKFDKLIKAMTIDQIAGKSSLAKGKAIRH